MILLITKRNVKKSNDYVNFKKHRKKEKKKRKNIRSQINAPSYMLEHVMKICHQ